MNIIFLQRKHALRAYSQALQIYKGKNWSLAEVTQIKFCTFRLNLDFTTLVLPLNNMASFHTICISVHQIFGMLK